MAASKAPHLTTITTTTPTTGILSVTTTSSTPLNSSSKALTSSSTLSSSTVLNPLLTCNINNTTVSFHDLCRSCGKTNDELYDLFQQTTNLITTASASASASATAASPFNTSTTTCYAHLTNKPTTTVGIGERTSSASTSLPAFDSAAATAKATAKGQSNMDNILQEMQIWQLMIKCNDGLPQRICAKCTAQFYMIHKFRRKCLKVQTQLRTLYEGQQQQQHQQQPQLQPQPQPEHKYQQEQEASVESRCKKQDETIDADESKPQIDIVTPSGDKTHKEEDHNDSAYNNVETEDQQYLMQQREQREAIVDDNDTLSVFFETPAQAVDTTLLDNVVAASLAKDEKKPLALESGSLLLPSQAVCDNERKSETTETVTTLQEKMANTEKTENTCNPNTLEPVNDDDAEKLQQIEDPSNVKNSQQIIVNTENVFITKAALKAYSTTNLNLNDQLTDQHDTRLSQEEQINNVCSSTSNLISPSCSSTTSTLNQKPIKRRRRKIQKNKRRCSLAHKSKTGRKQKAAVTIRSKQKSSRRNKLTFKHLSDVRTCLSTAKSTYKQVRKQKSRYVGRSLPMEDESSSSSTSSSSAVSITSTISASGSPSCSSALSSSAPTPAVADPFATQNLAYQTGFSTLELIERTASNKTVSSMWKTKAAMKANATDDLLVSEQHQQSATLTGSQTTSSLASSSSSYSYSSSSLMDDENKSLKTPKAKHNTTTTTNTTATTTTTTTTAISTNSLHSLNDHEFKEDNDDNVGNTNEEENTNENQQPEEVEQKQIETIAAAQTLQNDDQKTIEILPKNNINNEEQKPIVSTTPPAKTGCMKLILQRKRGTRFTCRRKNDNDNNDDEKHLQPTVSSKRRRKSLSSRSKSFSFTNDCDNNLKDFEEITMANDKMDRDPPEATTSSRSGFRCVAGDENKENPALHEYQQELDADSNLSIYRDPLLLRNDINEDDTNLADFPQNQLALHTECSKEMYRIYKEKTNLESPKKLIVRVPLTSLTQDFKRLHLTMEEQESNEDQESPKVNMTETNQPEAESMSSAQSQPTNDSNNENCSSGSDLLGFSQSTADSPTPSSSTNSSQYSVEAVRCVEPPLCSASSKINDFINDFQNNCIDSSEIEDSSEDTALPHLTPRIAQELSDEIRDVEDTLNGILSEMHDKDMYTPRSGTTDEFFAHSVYSPLTDTPTTPAHSFYAESPCTINSNPMSVSPFIHQNMDYNAMTPQSNHSSIGHGSQMGPANNNPNNGIFSEHFSSYKECFEESNQSELIGFQNDIPCFENIELVGKAETAEDLLAATAEVNEEPVIINNHTENNEVQTDGEEQIEQKHQPHQPHVVDYIDLSGFKETNEESSTTEVPNSPTEIVNPHIAYTANSYPQQQTLPLMTHENSSFISNTTTQPHYIVTNTNQGPILITNPSLSHGQEQIDAAFKPHSNNLQFITLGQAMEANGQMPANHLMNNTTAELNWPAAINAAPSNSYQQQPLLTTTTNGTTTYFINANGELYQASVPSSSVPNTILVPSQATQNSTTSIAFGKATNDNNERFVQNPTHQANTASTATSSQYIMVVNNVTGAPQYYATNSGLNQTPMAAATNITPPAVLYQPTPAATTNTGNLATNSTPSLDTINRSTPNLITIQRPEPTPAATKQSTFVPITPALPSSADNKNQTMHQKINQQLQRQIKERQQQLLQTRSPNSPQKITLICRFCHKRPKFTNNVDYSNHIINMHPAEKPYNCPHCPTNFSRRFERQQHVAQVHGSRYQCAQCGLSFCAQRALDFHLQKYHANLGSRAQEDQQQEQGQQQLQQQQNSASGMPTPATYQLLNQNQQQRLVRVEDVYVQMSDENKNRRSIDLSLDSADMKTSPAMQDVDLLSISSGNSLQRQQQTHKLCCPGCNGDNDDCCGGSNRNNDHKVQQRQSGFTGSESVNNRLQQQQQQQQLQPTQHVTIPSPEQTEPDSTTTLRHFRKRQLSEKSSVYSSTPALSSSTTTSSTGANGYSLSTNSDNSLAGDEGVEQHQQQLQQQQQQPQQQIVVERTLRDTHNCLLCEDSFTNEIALRKHHHLAHGTQTMATSNTVSTSLVCNICKRGFRMRNALQRHMETHDAEGRPYECNICHVRFPRPSQLTLHKLTVHKFEKPNSCNECGKQFGTESAMKAHTKVHEAAKTIAATTTTTLATISTVAVAATSSSSSLLSSSSSFSPTPRLSKRAYLDIMAAAITTTSSNSNASSSTAANKEKINLQSTTSGESTTTMTNNNNNTAAASVVSVATVANHVYNNNATQNTIVVSGLTT
ncbi:hypothetical protein DOY81_004491 [Sarcophaga bullata]|nr:hypothetical protein DOY81_004491 [Sarcophaga bullata]